VPAGFADPAGPGSVIVAADFIITPDMRRFRDLLTNGYRDAVEQTGAGFAPTFPTHSWYPPLIAIDHVLTRHAAAWPIRTIVVRGSDHRAAGHRRRAARTRIVLSKQLTRAL
jgi:endonuclease/exonuclease/phosphatase (EEP) superfamily protein YafD